MCLTMITTVHAESISEKNEESTEILSDEIRINSEVFEESESNVVSDSEGSEAIDMNVTNLSEVISESSEKDDDNFIDELISDSETIESEEGSNRETDEASKPEENTDEGNEVASKPEENTDEGNEVASEPEVDSDEETEVASEPEVDSGEETEVASEPEVDSGEETESETEEDTHTGFDVVHEESSSDVKYTIDFMNSPQISVYETINYPKVWNPSSLSYESTTDEACAIKEYHAQCNSPVIGKITNLSDIDVTVFFQFSPSKILYDNGVNISFNPIHLGNAQSGMNTANIEYAEIPSISEAVAHLLYNDITERGNYSFGTLTISVKAN